jgi:F-type H+-transporting ATPase subunit delta
VGYLPAILELFQNMRREAEGEIRAEVRSAYSLDEKTESAIAQALERKFGKRVSVASRVDEDLMGGLVIQAGDLVIDGSVKGGLEQLRNRLKA